MEILVYRKGCERAEEGFTPDELPVLLADKDSVVWVDILGETPEQIEEGKRVLLDVFKFHPLTIEDAVETRNQPKIEAFPTYLFFIVHGVRPEETDSSNFVTKELDGYLGENFVVTFHIERFRSIKVVKQQVRNSPFTCQRGAAYLLHQILDQLVDLYMPLVDDFDRAINELEERVFHMKKGGKTILEEIMDLRRSVARLRRISARQLDVLYRMSHGEFPQIPANVLPFFRDVHDHLVRLADESVYFQDRITSLLDAHLSNVSNQLNGVMKVLTIISTIFMPMTVLTGMYGMNVPLPHLPGGEDAQFWWILGIMAAVTCGMLGFFRTRRWI